MSISRRPKNIPIVSVQSTIGGALTEMMPTDNPTVPTLEPNSNMDSFKGYPFRTKT